MSLNRRRTLLCVTAIAAVSVCLCFPSAPRVIAQVARVTLESLQNQINGMINGTVKVGKATTADTANSVSWTNVANSPDFITVAQAEAAYVHKSGGTVSGRLNLDAGLKVGNSAETADASNTGLLRFNPAISRLEVSTLEGWKQLVTAEPGSVVQTVWAQANAPVVVTGTIPFDNTIPQQTEGQQVLIASITPKSSTNVLLVEAVINVAEKDNVQALTAALFRHTAPDAVAAVYEDPSPADSALGGFGTTSRQMVLRTTVPAGSTAPTSFRIRIGGNNGDVVLNGSPGSTNSALGGRVISHLSVTELWQ